MYLSDRLDCQLFKFWSSALKSKVEQNIDDLKLAFSDSTWLIHFSVLSIYPINVFDADLKSKMAAIIGHSLTLVYKKGGGGLENHLENTHHFEPTSVQE